MDNKLADVAKRGKLVESRRNTESGAFTSDIQTLQTRVKGMESDLKRLKDLVDNEKTDDLVSELQNLGDRQNLSQEELNLLLEEVAKVQKEVGEA
eukprot:CAMPEP_0202967680 /NCGR_PEP_ID=MMETSP1396-20130829/12664_1 /ASSEMBLY_ACC=CAM_ASM_000872 /TAXON_ID= /ORGANISM="Pseudokeronopsis sp., Strain Brazil" /LENGTH=94 /DNA_ID=CAMNT_0049693045 /DNA_START=643 /DNA_END=923 /DNA_ORIENTATION=+